MLRTLPRGISMPRLDARGAFARLPWSRLALPAILVLSAALELAWIGREGYGNGYYAATVKSMLTSWPSFFFASFDPGGFVTVDKPPVGFWIQAAFAKVLGFHGWVLILPQVLAAVASVALLHHLVRRAFGPVAAAVAALVLALMPVSVATARNNTIDSLLVFALLGAAWAILRAVGAADEPRAFRWLLAAMALVGVGFNIKMLQAYLPLPAFYLVYLACAPVRIGRRFVHLGLATVVLLVVSLSWAVAVDLTPPDQRPYIGSSADNSVRELILGHNGLARLLPGWQLFGGRGMGPKGPVSGVAPGPGVAGSPAPGMVTVSMNGESGDPGPLRLFNAQLAGQISWLLPLALVGLVVAGWQLRPRRLRPVRAFLRRAVAPGPSHAGVRGAVARRRAALIFWGGWLLSTGAYFSVGNIFHLYYLVMLAPAVGALSGVAVAALWRDYRRAARLRTRRGWLFPLALIGCATVQGFLLIEYPDWRFWLTPFAVGGSLLAALGLTTLRLRSWPRRGAIGIGFASLAVTVLLTTPTIWSLYSVWYAPGLPLPSAGPPARQGGPQVAVANPSGGGMMQIPLNPAGRAAMRAIGDGPMQTDARLIAYLQANRGGARYLAATQSTGEASGIILATGDAVMAMGGFNGSDPILTPERLAQLVRDGVVRHFLLPPTREPDNALSPQPSSSQPQPGPTLTISGGFGQGELTAWVVEHCSPVPPSAWQGAQPDPAPSDPATSGPILRGGFADNGLYDCGAMRK